MTIQGTPGQMTALNSIRRIVNSPNPTKVRLKHTPEGDQFWVGGHRFTLGIHAWLMENEVLLAIETNKDFTEYVTSKKL